MDLWDLYVAACDAYRADPSNENAKQLDAARARAISSTFPMQRAGVVA